MSDPRHHHPHPSSDYFSSPQMYTYTPSQTSPPSRIPRPITTPTSTSTASSVGTNRKAPFSASTVSLSATGNAYGSPFPGNTSTATRRRDTHGDYAQPNGAFPGVKPHQHLSASNSRKRARPLSTDLTAQPSFASSRNANHGLPSTFSPAARFSDLPIPSPPPPVNLNYDLAGGGAYTPGFLTTPSGLGGRKMSESSLVSVGRSNEGRFARREWLSRGDDEAVETDGDIDMGGGITSHEGSFESSGAHQSQQETTPRGRAQEPTKSQPGWGTFMLGVVGGVVGGVLEFCRNSVAFRGFHAGGGQGYDIAPPNTPANQNWREVAASENMWEDDDDDDTSRRIRDDDSMVRSYDRLETPIPGDYPPSPDESEIYEIPRDEESERGSKRRQSDRGEWVVVPSVESAAAAARRKDAPRRQSRTTSPMPLDGSATRLRQSYAYSPTVANRRIASGRRPKHRVSYAGSPAQQQQEFDAQQRPSSRGKQRYSTGTFSPLSPGESKKTSPPSVEAKKYAARIRREERVVEQKVEKLNDKLLEMIRQGKEALGAKVEIVEDEEEELF